MEDLGLREHEPLDRGVVLRHPPLDDVGREREGRADEAEDGRLVPDLGAQAAERLADKGDRLLRPQLRDRVDLRLRAHGVEDHRPLPRGDVKGDVHPGDGREDVGEEDDPVGAEGAPGLGGARGCREGRGEVGARAGARL